MLIRDNLLGWFLRCLKTINSGQGGIFHWDRSQQKLVSNSNEQLKYFKILYYFSWTFVPIVIIQLLFSRQVPRSLLFQSIFFTVAFIGSLYIQLTLYRWREEIAVHFNALLQFEERQYHSYTTLRDWKSYLVKIIIFLAILSSPVLPLAYGGMIYMQPCIPCNFGYMMVPQCHSHIISHSVPNFLVKFPIVIINVVMSRFLFTGFILEAAGFAVIQCHCIGNMLLLLKRVLVGPRGNKSEQLFRQVQILEIIFNNFQQNSIIYKLATMTITLPISLFALIKVPLNLAQKLFFLLAVVDSPVVILCNFGIIAEVHNASTALLKAMESNLTTQRNKYLKLTVRSWPVLKAKFGPANYVDKVTPVKSLDISLNVTASLLLMS